MRPEYFRPLISQIARPLPITARAPLSRYLKGLVAPGCPCLIALATWAACWMATVARPGSGRSPGPSRLAMSPITEISGWPGTVRSG